jgi:ribonuclease HI
MAPFLPEVTLVELIMTAIWYIWWERRQATHGELIRQPVRSAQAILALVTNYTRARKKENQGILRHGWVRPKEDYVKLNVDASFDADSGFGAAGVIIRDEHGLFVAGSNCIIPFVDSVATAEAMALRDGLTKAESMGCSRLVVNSDCIEVIQIMKNGGYTQGPAAAIYDDCVYLCREFVDVIFEHCPREANNAAHVLAREAVVNPHVWVDDPPDFLVDVIANDVSVFPKLI